MEDKIVNEVAYFENLSADQWSDWIDDILYYGVAYPRSRISPDGDVLQEIIGLLNTNGISLRNYEQGIANIINKLYTPQGDPIKISRLIDVLIIAKSYKGKEILKKIFFNREGDLLRNSYDTIRSQSLHGLSRLELTEDEKKQIIEHIVKNCDSELQTNPAFLGNYLRFLRFQSENIVFFEGISYALTTVKTGDDRIFDQRVASTIVGMLKEYHSYHNVLFFKHFYEWLSKVYENFNENNLFLSVISLFELYIKSSSVSKEIANPFSQDANYEKNIITLLDLIIEVPTSNMISFNDCQELAGFVLNVGEEKFIESISLKIQNKSDLSISSREGIVIYNGQSRPIRDALSLVQLVNKKPIRYSRPKEKLIRSIEDILAVEQ